MATHPVTRGRLTPHNHPRRSGGTTSRATASSVAGMETTTSASLELNPALLLPRLVFPTGRPSRRMCAKHTYPTKRDALTARNAAFYRRRNRPEFLRAYPCAECRGWHLIHQRSVEEEN